MEYLRWRPEFSFNDDIRRRVYNSRFWEDLKGLSRTELREKGKQLTSFGSFQKNGEPTEFLCVLMKMIHLMPYDCRYVGKEYVTDDDFPKYIRLLGAFYVRFIGVDEAAYAFIETLLGDNREIEEVSRGGDNSRTLVKFVASRLLRRGDFWPGFFAPLLIDREVLAHNSLVLTPMYRFWEPSMLISKRTKERIFGCEFYSLHCREHSVHILKEKTKLLDHFGGTIGKEKNPTPFLCLLCMMLHISVPRHQLLSLFIKQNDSRYALLLGIFFSRITSKEMDVFTDLEPVYDDHREVKKRKRGGDYKSMSFGKVANHLLRDEIFCELTLPPISIFF